jgi:predicted RNase H-like HicB family nuclease
MKYRVTIVESEEGVAVWCDDLPGCVSQGSSRAEALDNIREAIKEYLDAIPEVQKRFGTRVTREEILV